LVNLCALRNNPIGTGTGDSIIGKRINSYKLTNQTSQTINSNESMNE
jgi:hypothetical protein